jgi:hypothetical protein
MRNLGQEIDSARISEGDLKDILPKASMSFVANGGRSEENVLAALEGRDATTMVLAFVFLFLAAETILAWPRRKLAMALVLFALFATPTSLHAGTGNDFVFSQLKYAGAWDPYPDVQDAIFQMIRTMTNISYAPDRRVVTLDDESVFDTPFLIVEGNSALPFSSAQKIQLKQFIDRGGLVFFDDSLADPKGPFAQSVRQLMAELYPDRAFQKLPMDHALFRSFFLLRNVAGRRIAERSLEGLDVGGGLGGEGRTAVIYCPNDLHGSWMNDRLGHYASSCEPGGEPQRWESFKLTINLIYFSLTGTYKKDAIHQPFIEMKLGS